MTISFLVVRRSEEDVPAWLRRQSSCHSYYACKCREIVRCYLWSCVSTKRSLPVLIGPDWSVPSIAAMYDVRLVIDWFCSCRRCWQTKQSLSFSGVCNRRLNFSCAQAAHRIVHLSGREKSDQKPRMRIRAVICYERVIVEMTHSLVENEKTCARAIREVANVSCTSWSCTYSSMPFQSVPF